MEDSENAKSSLRIFVSKNCNSLICWMCTFEEEGFGLSPALALYGCGMMFFILWLWLRELYIHVFVQVEKGTESFRDQHLSSLMWAKKDRQCNMFLYSYRPLIWMYDDYLI